MILESGLIRTLDPHLPTQRALAIAGAWIAGGVGVHETALASPDVVDLGGRTVVPGFTDARVVAGDDLASVRTALKAAAARGATTVHTVDGLPLWAELEAVGGLPLRVWQLLTPEQWDPLSGLGLRVGFGSSHVRLGSTLPYEAPEFADVYGSGRRLAEVDPLADLPAGVRFAEALARMTLRPAALRGEAHRSGKLLPGFAADLVVLDRDPWQHAAPEVVATMVAGRWTHNPPPWRC